MTKVERLKEIWRLALEPDAVDLREITIGDAFITIGTGVFLAGLSGVQLFLGACQLLGGFMLALYDLIKMGLDKIMPKTPQANSGH